MNAQDLIAAEHKFGIHFVDRMGTRMPGLDFQKEGAMLRALPHGGFACDAQPALITVSNAGIPAFMLNLVDPQAIRVLVSPMQAAEIVGQEIKKGNWTTRTAMFRMVESTGQVSAYDDYSTSGVAGSNNNWPQRQSFHYQVMTQYGERELADTGEGQIDLVNDLNIASILTLNKYQNTSYFFGVTGIACYGLLNDPNLPAAIVPNTKAAGGTSWANATVPEVMADLSKQYKQLLAQSGGLINLKTPMIWAMSPTAQANMVKTTDFNVNIGDQIKKNYPNLEIVTAVEYGMGGSGELTQLIVKEMDGQRTVDLAFTEKLRAHPTVIKASSFEQKKSQGTWGAIWYRPVLCAQMLGV